MPLLNLWDNNRDQIRSYALWQIVAMAGNGKLGDGSTCSDELRRFFGIVDEDLLERFVAECLEASFDDSGFVLQDLANEIGRRLEFEVEPGVYRGRRGTTGFDGIWKGGAGLEFLIEVKTTDTYNAQLDQIEGYRRELIQQERLGVDSSILFVVGRQDTGAVEAQIRGSRYAWTMRVIGASSLIRLMKVKVNSESNRIVRRIQAVLRPLEYTRIDGIVDLVFDAAEEAAAAPEEPPISTTSQQEVQIDPETRRSPSSTPSKEIELLREQAAEVISAKLGVQLTRRRRSLFATPDDSVHAVLAISKRYDRDYQAYWYGFYDVHLEYLKESRAGYLALGALDTRKVYCIPRDVIEPLLSRMKTTVRDEGQMYWHIATKLVGEECRLIVAGEEISLTEYEIQA